MLRKSPAATFATRLEQYGAAIAVIAEDGERLTYAELAARADVFGETLGPAPQLLLIEAANEIEPLVAYLGALRHGHPVVMAASDSDRQLQRIIETYKPDVRFRKSCRGWVAEQQPPSSRALHPDLAVLLSTSGSTGAAKLVRLAHDAVEANAQSIVEYLSLGAADRAITTLPIHYSYGLSVVTSHLTVGATLLLTKRSVIEEEFWNFFTAEGGTSMAGVPSTYELLDRIGFRGRNLPTLRSMTQAGGRLPAEMARVYGEWSKDAGVRFFVMYGQTEATARMAYVPPELLLDNPGSIGVPIPGGAFHLIDESGQFIGTPGTPGELVYSGPNVMMGYAVAEADLEKGRELTELRTGDLAVLNPHGLYQIVGRKSRFSKLFGLRISLDEVETALARRDVKSVVAGDDELLAVAVLGDAPGDIAQALAVDLKLPLSVITVVTYQDFPSLSSGKLDYQAILKDGKAQQAAIDVPASNTPIRHAFQRTFPQAHVNPKDSFISLGGDSLSYVRLSMEIEGAIGILPERWEEKTIATLDALAKNATRTTRNMFTLRGVESEVVIRAAAILAVVANHASSYVVGGGAHVLLMLSGYNFSRYQRARLVEGGGFSVLSSFFKRIIIPYYVILIAYFAVKQTLDAPSLLLISNFYGRSGSLLEPYWFLEALLQCMIILVGLFSLPPVRRAAARDPWTFGLALLAGALVVRVITYAFFQHGGLADRTPDAIFYLLAFGWCLHQATTRVRRLLLTGMALVITLLQVAGPENIWNRFTYPSSVSHALWFMTSASLILWAPRLLLPNILHTTVGAIATASFYIYLTHGVPVHILVQILGVDNLALVLPVSVLIGLATYWLSQSVAERKAFSIT